MRNLTVGIAVVVSLVATAEAGVQRSIVRGSGVTATFSVSDECIEMTGELAAVSTNDGTSAIVSAQRTDYCAEDGPVSWFYLSGGPVQLTTLGMIGASVNGSIEMSPYSGPTGGDVTLDLALVFRGVGAVSTTRSHYHSGSPGSLTLSFSSTRQRNATTAGAFSVDGVDGTLANAQLVSSLQGELVITR